MQNLLIITGSNGGIGKEIVNTYLEDNFIVIGMDIINTILDSQIDKQSHKNFFYIDTDLYQYANDELYRYEISKNIRTIFPESIERFVIINNAAQQILNPVDKISVKDFEKTLSVNTFAPFFLVQTFLKDLKKYNSHVVNISSIHAKLTKSNFLCYAASKASLESITRSLAIELASYNISFNTVSPAAIYTHMLESSFMRNMKKIKELEGYHPSKSIGKPKDLALLIKMITDQKSSFLNGSNIEFNGGIGSILHDPDPWNV